MEAIEPALAQLLDRAQDAGWGRQEAVRAICVLIWQSMQPAEDDEVAAA